MSTRPSRNAIPIPQRRRPAWPLSRCGIVIIEQARAVLRTCHRARRARRLHVLRIRDVAARYRRRARPGECFSCRRPSRPTRLTLRRISCLVSAHRMPSITPKPWSISVAPPRFFRGRRTSGRRYRMLITGSAVPLRLAPQRCARLRCAHTDHETEMAQNALRLIEEPQTIARAKQPDVITPDSWTNRKGDQSVSGELILVDCGERSARLHVRTSSETLVLNVKDPSTVVMRGGARAAFLRLRPAATHIGSGGVLRRDERSDRYRVPLKRAILLECALP